MMSKNSKGQNTLSSKNKLMEYFLFLKEPSPIKDITIRRNGKVPLGEQPWWLYSLLCTSGTWPETYFVKEPKNRDNTQRIRPKKAAFNTLR